MKLALVRCARRALFLAAVALDVLDSFLEPHDPGNRGDGVL